MNISQSNPHLDALISSLYREALEGAPVELQIRRASEVDMSLDTYRKWIEEFPFLSRGEQDNHITTLLRVHIAQDTYNALAARLTISSPSSSSSSTR